MSPRDDDPAVEHLLRTDLERLGSHDVDGWWGVLILCERGFRPIESATVAPAPHRSSR